MADGLFELLDKMSSGFVTESELEAAKKARQEEWERVRKPDDPENAPEPEPQDNRSLFHRLEEQRLAKQEEWDEAHKLKNQVGFIILVPVVVCIPHTRMT